MKIIYTANSRIPTEKAHGIQIIKMCNAFANSKLEEKVEVELVIPRRFNWIKKDAFDYYDVERNFKIKKLPCLDLIPLDKYIGYLGFWIENFTFSLSTFLYLLFKKADLIYSRNLPSLFLLSFFKKNLFYEMHDFPQKFQRKLCQIIFKKIKGVITTNEWKKKETQKVFGLREDKILKAFNGVDLEKFNLKKTKLECRKKLELPEDKKIILYVGHLYSWKGVDTLTEASQYLPKDAKIYFIGGTEKDIKKFKIKNQPYREWQAPAKFKNLIVIGHRPHSEIPFWLKSADVLVLPNTAKQDISKYWTSPLKMFEYMASGTPIVASDIPSIREIVDENSAFLVKPDDALSLAQGINELLKNPTFCSRLSLSALQVVKNYSWEKRAKKILKFILRKKA